MLVELAAAVDLLWFQNVLCCFSRCYRVFSKEVRLEHMAAQLDEVTVVASALCRRSWFRSRTENQAFQPNVVAELASNLHGKTKH